MRGRPSKIHFIVFKFDHCHSETEHHLLRRGKIKPMIPTDYFTLSMVLNSYRSFARSHRRTDSFYTDILTLDMLQKDGLYLILRDIKYRRGLKEPYYLSKIGLLSCPCFISSLTVRYTPLKCDNPSTN